MQFILQVIAQVRLQCLVVMVYDVDDRVLYLFYQLLSFVVQQFETEGPDRCSYYSDRKSVV